MVIGYRPLSYGMRPHTVRAPEPPLFVNRWSAARWRIGRSLNAQRAVPFMHSVSAYSEPWDTARWKYNRRPAVGKSGSIALSE